jgi:2-polyprenyl-6-methoxyphenol hydroxylase-like FAD-dependent oxidoreductase
MGVSEGTRVPVLIVGAGPSGLLAAAELARHGVRARIVEREPVPPREARATALQPGTLEILAQAGVVSQVLLSSVHLRYARVLDPELQPVAETDFAGVGCPWEFQCSLPQWRTEQILAGRLAEHGVVVDRGTEVVSMDDGGDRVHVTLKRADGTAEIIEADWVIGAGGAHSVTRESMAVDLAGDTYPGTALVADVRVTCPIGRDGSALIACPGGYVLLAPLPDGHWLTFVGDLHEDEAERLEHDISIGAVAGAIQRRAPDAIRLTDVGWAATFRMHRRLAPELADGRRFLLGDAGHLSSPFGGEGLNSGLHDAHNLAWKLALELQGRARPALTDSFAAERGAAARHVLETSDRLHQLVHAAVESARTGSRAAAPSPEQARALLRARSMLDVCYAGSALAADYTAPGNTGPQGAPRPGDRYPDRASLTGTGHHLLLSGDIDAGAAARLTRRWAGLVDVGTGTGESSTGESSTGESSTGESGTGRPGVLLVRPDGYIGFRAPEADAAALRALDAHLASYLIPA